MDVTLGRHSSSTDPEKITNLSRTTPTTYAMVFASLGDYRRRTILSVSEILGSQLAIYSGTRSVESSIIILTPEDLPFIELTNRVLPGGILIQNVPWRRMLTVDSLLLDLNPRMPFVWITALARRGLRKRTVLWGHAWPRAGRGARSERLRRLLRQIPDGLVAYTPGQARQLEALHPAKSIYCAPNSLYYRSEIRFNEATARKSIVCVGRLHSDKKPTILLRAFDRVARRIPEVDLIYVGAGPQLAETQALAESLDLMDRVTFAGHVSDRNQLANMYDHAFVSISPGYAGLAVMQSLSFGVPVIISRDEPHAPEYEAASEGVNCILFDTDDVDSLADQIVKIWASKDQWHARGASIAEECARSYCVEEMVAGLVASLKGEDQKWSRTS